MSNRTSKFLKKSDKLLILILLSFAVIGFLLLWFINGDKKVSSVSANITYKGKVVKAIELEKLNASEEINIQGDLPVTILVEKGRICFKDSECPDKICINTGWLSNPGEIAVCMPAKVAIKIDGKQKEYDSITG